MKKYKVSIFTKYMLLVFMLGLMAGSVAEAKVTKPAFAERFEKKKAYKHRGGNVITVKQRVQK